MQSISDYIVNEIKLPETGARFLNRMEEFSYNLITNAKAYKTCRFPEWARKGYQCAVFEGNWMFAFIIKKKELIIKEIRYGAYLNY